MLFVWREQRLVRRHAAFPATACDAGALARILDPSEPIANIERYPRLGSIAGLKNDARAVGAQLSGPGQLRTKQLRDSALSAALFRVHLEELLTGLRTRDGVGIVFAGHGEVSVKGHLRPMPSDADRALQGRHLRRTRASHPKKARSSVARRAVRRYGSSAGPRLLGVTRASGAERFHE